MSNVPYYKKETLDNMEVTYYGSGVIEVELYAHGGIIKTLIAIEDLEKIARNGREHMEDYQSI